VEILALAAPPLPNFSLQAAISQLTDNGNRLKRRSHSTPQHDSGNPISDDQGSALRGAIDRIVAITWAKRAAEAY
jgi:hypothetical protein